MKDIKELAREVMDMQEELEKFSPVDPKFSELLARMTEKMAVVDKIRGRQEDLNSAKYLLNKHGYAFKIFGPEDVERLLQSAEDSDGAGRDIAKIVSHVVEGDDWQTMADVTGEDEANLWAMISGTKGDHPEWFGTSKQDY